MQYLGPLFPGWDGLKQDKREARLNSFAEGVRDHMREIHIRACRLRCSPGLDDARAFQWLGFDAVPRYTYTLPVVDVEIVWGGVKRNVRSYIRRHEASVDMGLGNAADWIAFERQLHARYSEQGLNAPLPDGYLARLRDALGSDLVLLAARKSGDFVGGAALIRMRDRIALWQGTVRGPPGIPVNDLLVWEAIRYARDVGCVEFELMGANTRQLASFKSKFNPTLNTYLEVRRLPVWAAVIAGFGLHRGGVGR